MPNRERELWRARASRLDAIYLRLRNVGPATPEKLARELGYEVKDVRELLDDLHIDHIVKRHADIYAESDDDWYLH